MKALIGVGVLIILALIFLYPGGSIIKAFYVVDEKDLVIVTRFGEVRSVKTSPGINAKVPFLDAVIRFDRRILRIDSPPIAMPDKEKQNLVIDSYARYRIIDPVQFRKTLQTEVLARSRLGDIVTSSLRAEIARKDRSEIIGARQIQDASGNPVLDDEGLPRIEGSESRSALLEAVVAGVRNRVIAQEATARAEVPSGRDTFTLVLPIQISEVDVEVRDAPDGGVVEGPDIEAIRVDLESSTITLRIQQGEEVPAGTPYSVQYFVERDEPFGIEIVDVRIKRADFPDSVTPSIFTRMRAERNRIATRFRSEGDEEDLKIRADANRRREVILANADQESNEIRGDGEAEAIRILAEALEADPEFFAFRRSLEAYSQVLNQGTTVILSADADIFQFLQSPGAGTPAAGGGESGNP